VLTFVVALLSGFAVGAVFRVGHLVHTTAGAVTPAIIATIVVAILLMRRVGKKLQPTLEDAQRHLQAGRRELALKSLRSGLEHRHWHPLIEAQLRTQIGAMLYAQGDIDGAIAELAKASSRPWESPAFLGCAYFKKREEEPMRKAFEKAIKIGAKDSLSYTVYAWCMVARGNKDAAIKILEKAVAKMPADQRLKANLELVQTGKKMKVAPYGDRWAAFGLDSRPRFRAAPGLPPRLPPKTRPPLALEPYVRRRHSVRARRSSSRPRAAVVIARNWRRSWRTSIASTRVRSSASRNEAHQTPVARRRARHSRTPSPRLRRQRRRAGRGTARIRVGNAAGDFW
jgi:hypothetical protein